MHTSPNITWLFNSIGYNNKLLYMEPILKAFVSKFPNTVILTCDTEARIADTNYEVKKAIPRLALQIGSKVFNAPSPSAIFKLSQLKPDLIVINEFGLLSFYAVLYKLFKRNTRVLLLVENDPIYLKYYGVPRNSPAYDLVRRFIGRLANKVLCNNDKTANYLVHQLGIAAKKVVSACYLTSVIDIRKPNTDHNGNLVLLYVGQLIPRKGLHHLIKAIARLPLEQRSRLRLEVLGEGPERNVLEKLISDSGLTGLVNLRGAQPYEKMGYFYGAADIFVLPTLGDYRALVGFEALSANLPIIGSIFDGASYETIEEGVNGFAVDPTNEEALTKIIKLFLDNPELIEKFGKESKRIAEKYRVSIAAENLINACKECLAD